MSEIEAGYVAQGYVLPEGFTWEIVAESRAKYDIGAIYVPVVAGHGCCAWGVPIVNGAFLKHP